MLAALREAGPEIDREGQDYISVKDPGQREKIRLKGGVYGADWKFENSGERMKEKAEQERIETEKIFKEQLLTLRDSLQPSPQNALSTMSDAMGREITDARQRLSEQHRLLSMAFGRKWIVLASLGAGLCLGMLAAGWLMVEIWAWQLADYRSELAQLKQEHQTVRRELEAMRPERAKAETRGLSFYESQNGQFIIVSVGWQSTRRGRRARISLLNWSDRS